MASALPSCPPLPPPLPFPLCHFPENPSSKSLLPTPTELKQYHNSPSYSHTPALSVETRIRSAKHGIAVSVCLVDTSAAPSPGLVKAKEAEPKPIGWVSPNTWNSSFTEADKPSTQSRAAGDNASVQQVAEEGDYIDIQQATVLFGKAQSVTEEKKKSEMETGERFPQRQTPMESCMQRQTRTPHQDDVPPHRHCPPSPASSAPRHSQQTRPEPSQCVHTVRFSEKPCTPCTRRKQGDVVSKALDLRCRYRESYQAALQNPVSLGQERQSAGMSALVEEEGDAQMETRGPWCRGQRIPAVPQIQNQSSVAGSICKESGERNTAPHWKPGDPSSAGCVDYRGTNAVNAELASQRTTVTFRDSREKPHDKAYGSVDHWTPADPRLSDTRHGSAYTCSDVLVTTGSTAAGPSVSQPLSQDRREPASDGRCSSLSTAVVDTSEKCELVLVEGQKVRRRETSGAEVPQLHVVKCKKSTAFRLVSPKISRRNVSASGAPVS